MRSRRSRHLGSLKPHLVEFVKLEPTIKLDIRYATTNNFQVVVPSTSASYTYDLNNQMTSASRAQANVDGGFLPRP